nr:glycosyltransferase family 2 protein [Frankia sp. R82]
MEGLKILHPAPRVHLRRSGPRVSVVIPAMNEARNLPWLARRMPAGVHELILVDGRSVDDTISVARELWPQVRVLTQTRRGKGNALACGFHAAAGDLIVMIDADGSMDPGEIPYFVAALEAGADYVKGSRFISGGGSSDITRVRALGNQALNRLTNWAHKSAFTDLCYGYNAFWTRILPVLGLDQGSPDESSQERFWGDGFEVETMINIRAQASGLRIAEVPSYESTRLHGRSNLNAVSDGLRVLRTIAVEYQASRRGQAAGAPRATRLVARQAARPTGLPAIPTQPAAASPQSAVPAKPAAVPAKPAAVPVLPTSAPNAPAFPLSEGTPA